MNKLLTIVGAVGIAALGFIILVRLVTPEDTSRVTPVVTTQHLNADAYPLYNNLSWGAEQSKIFENKFSGYEVVSVPVTNITDLAAVSMPFDAYYKAKLEAVGWVVDNALAAGGPGASFTGYKKGSEYIIVSYTTLFKGTKPNEPVQCPCDISFSVFSGSAL